MVVGKIADKKTVPVMVGSPVEQLAGSLPTQTTYNVNHQPVQTSEATGTVQRWDPCSGMIGFVRDNVLLTAVIDPAVAVIYTPSLKVKNKEIKITAKGGNEWQTVFCRGDL